MWTKIWTQTLGAAIPSPVRGEWLRWLPLVTGFWLMVATRPLWLNRGEFPQVPWFAWGCGIPPWVDFGLLAMVCVAALAVSCTSTESRANRLSLFCFAGALCGLMVLDQHRCQPWAYQLVLMALILAWTRHDPAIGLLRLLTVGIYVHSAISKFDWSFCTGSGRSFLVVLWTLLSGQAPAANAWQNSLWPLVFPVAELLIAVGLIWPVTRRWALWSAAGMHLLLIWMLGPWGLNHSAGVLIWNLFFIAQNWILFGHGRRHGVIQESESSVLSTWGMIQQRSAIVLTTWAVVWPLSEPWGYCDLWPAWGLYAQHGERLSVFVTDAALRRLPPIWQETAIPRNDREPESRTWQLQPQQVSLRQTQAPVYPQNRFLLGVTLALARDATLSPDQIWATWYTPANRWTGKHATFELKNLDEIERASANCFWNARPRKYR